jgi:hypothetical protein
MELLTSIGPPILNLQAGWAASRREDLNLQPPVYKIPVSAKLKLLKHIDFIINPSIPHLFPFLEIARLTQDSHKILLNPLQDCGF